MKRTKTKTIEVVRRGFNLCDDNYNKLIEESYKLKTRNISDVINHILDVGLTEEKIKSRIEDQVSWIKKQLKNRFTNKQPISPPETPLFKSMNRRYFELKPEHADKLNELAYITNKPIYVLLNEIIDEYFLG